MTPRKILTELKFALPVALFAALTAALFVGLSLNPREIPSALVLKPVPEFTLPPVRGRALGLSDANLREGKPTLVNVFASWCVACRAEHPLFMELARSGEVAIHGLNYKDEPEAARAWLDRLGDPYLRTGADRQGRVGIDFGVYGVPETFVITGDGRIACKHIGAVDAVDLEEKILPLARALGQGEVANPAC
jgi:cytochrome c biogenesis protein CcmG/thiol:disulfide interchange protein DsbE